MEVPTYTDHYEATNYNPPEYDEKGESAFDTKKAVLPARELNRLKKQLADAQLENEILKKAMAYFAKQDEKK